jgi:preprotein translocase SecE subunit
MDKIINYFITAKEELLKVIWPSQKDTIRYSLLIIAMSIAVAAFFGLLDFVFNLGFEKLIK